MTVSCLCDMPCRSYIHNRLFYIECPTDHVKPGLSKSRILNHRQCPKRLYLQTNRPDLAEESAETQQAFAVGHKVGEIARSLIPDGILIGHDRELKKALDETQAALARQPATPIFEATFQRDGVLVRADLLLPGERGRRLVEVKAAAEIKEHYPADCAIQAWVADGAGCRIERVELAHIDNQFVYPGNGDYRGLLHHEDVTELIQPLIEQVPTWAEEARRTLAGAEPTVEPGKRCKQPHECPFISYCSPPLATEYPVTALYNDKGKKVAASLLAKGISDIRQIPPEWPLNETHERQRRGMVSGKAELDPEAGRLLRSFPYPRYYMDFETIAPAVPIWVGTRPYQKLPFQWSCHIETAGGDLLHEEFLGLPPEPPMREFAERLTRALAVKGEGPVFVYNQSFEAGRLRELGQMFPELKPRLDRIIERMVDLWPIAQKYYYHPVMMGSWSLKAVLPTVAPELDYDRLEHVQHGGMAEAAYLEILDSNTAVERRAELIRALREYCGQDTLGLVKLARYFMRGKVA